MNLSAGHVTVLTSSTDASELLGAVGARSDALGGYLAAESIGFRIMKGLVAPYLHAGQRTTIRSWMDAGSTVEASVGMTPRDERGRQEMNCSLTIGGDSPVQQTGVLFFVSSAPGKQRSSTPTPSAESVDGETVDRWTPSAEQVRTYSGWGHPNSHTDETFARSIGLGGRIVQGLMVQSRLMALLIDAGELRPPFTIVSTFRRPMPLGEELTIRRTDSTSFIVSLPDVPVAMRVEISPA